jgi:hypothetical protein
LRVVLPMVVLRGALLLLLLWTRPLLLARRLPLRLPLRRVLPLRLQLLLRLVLQRGIYVVVDSTPITRFGGAMR